MRSAPSGRIQNGGAHRRAGRGHRRRLHPGRGAPGADRRDRPATRRATAGRPATVDAFDAGMIEQAGITSMRDYVGMAPQISLVETQNIGFTFVNVRGLSQVRNSEPTVAVVVDGVLQTTGLGFSEELYDIEQVEVLEGPAGRLVRTKRQRRRDQHHDAAADERARRVRAGRLRQRREHGLHRVGQRRSGPQHAAGPRRGLVQGRRGLAREHHARPEGRSVHRPVVSRPAAVAAGSRGERRREVRLLEHGSAAVAVRLECTQFRGGAAGGRPAGSRREHRRQEQRLGDGAAGGAAVDRRPRRRSEQHERPDAGQHSRRRRSDGHGGLRQDRLADQAGTVTSVTSFDALDLVGTLETFPYFPFLQSSADPTAGTRDDALVLPPAVFGPLATVNATTGQNRFHDAWSQEVRITSPDKQRLRWILGGYYVGHRSRRDDLGQPRHRRRRRRAGDGPEHRRRRIRRRRGTSGSSRRSLRCSPPTLARSRRPASPVRCRPPSAPRTSPTRTRTPPRWRTTSIATTTTRMRFSDRRTST